MMCYDVIFQSMRSRGPVFVRSPAGLLARMSVCVIGLHAIFEGTSSRDTAKAGLPAAICS